MSFASLKLATNSYKNAFALLFERRRRHIKKDVSKLELIWDWTTVSEGESQIHSYTKCIF